MRAINNVIASEEGRQGGDFRFLPALKLDAIRRPRTERYSVIAESETGRKRDENF